jgi:4-hydroxy-tetrahydrodipicolinate reductase
MATPIKVALNGASGRMGTEILRLIDAQIKFLEPLDPSSMAKSNADLVVDFSSPQGCVVAANWCVKNGVPLISGTTGLTTLQEKEIKLASKKIPLFWSPNMSIGLNAMAKALNVFSKNFACGEVAIEEFHHKNKKDSPSGTAKFLERIVKGAVSKATVVSEPVGIRGGDIFGIHKVYFFGDGEWVSFEHHASGRAVFAKGAIEAGKWLVKQKPGFYGMADFLMGSSE